MKYIPLTEHLTTVAMLYEKCAELSSQIDELQLKILKSPQNPDNSRIVQQVILDPPELQSSQGKQDDEQSNNVLIEEQEYSRKSSVSKQSKQTKQTEEEEEEEEKQNNLKKANKKIEKVRKETNSLLCEHCGKVFQTQKKFKKHQYGVRYRKKFSSNKKDKEISQSKSQHEESQNEVKGLKQKKFYVSL